MFTINSSNNDILWNSLNSIVLIITRMHLIIHRAVAPRNSNQNKQNKFFSSEFILISRFLTTWIQSICWLNFTTCTQLTVPHHIRIREARKAAKKWFLSTRQNLKLTSVCWGEFIGWLDLFPDQFATGKGQNSKRCQPCGEFWGNYVNLPHLISSNSRFNFPRKFFLRQPKTRQNDLETKTFLHLICLCRNCWFGKYSRFLSTRHNLKLTSVC